MKIPCYYEGCKDWHAPEGQPPEHQTVEVPDDFEGRCFCSVECMLHQRAQDVDRMEEPFRKWLYQVRKALRELPYRQKPDSPIMNWTEGFGPWYCKGCDPETGAHWIWQMWNQRQQI